MLNFAVSQKHFDRFLRVKHGYGAFSEYYKHIREISFSPLVNTSPRRCHHNSIVAVYLIVNI